MYQLNKSYQHDRRVKENEDFPSEWNHDVYKSTAVLSSSDL